MSDPSANGQLTDSRQKVANHGRLAADALQRCLCEALATGLNDFSAKASELGATDDEIRRLAMREFRGKVDPIRAKMLEELARNFDPDAEQRAMQATIAINFEDLTLQEPESLDESIAMTNVGNKAELLYEHQLWELRQRMVWWRLEPYPQVSDKSLAPYAICRAFFEAMRKAGVKPEFRLPIFHQFDRHVLRKLHETYEELIRILDRHGFTPLNARKKAAEDTAADIDSTADSTVNDRSAAAVKRAGVDPQTWQMLSQFAHPQGAAESHHSGGPVVAAGSHTAGPFGAQNSAGNALASPGSAYSDANLAQDLAAVLSGQSVAGWSPEAAKNLEAQAAIFGRVFNEMVGDPHVARGVKGEFDHLRFNALKAALADPGFFRDPAHPQRSLLEELASLAFVSRLQGAAEQQRFRQMLTAMQQQFAVDPQQVRKAQQDGLSVSEQELDRFLDDQAAQQKSRRVQLIEKARSVVSEELWLQTAARNCSEGLKHTLASGWEPMMALRLLRHGVSSKMWQRGIALLKRIVDLADPPKGSSIAAADVQALSSDFAQELVGVGMVADRVQRLRDALQSNLLDAAQVAPEQRPKEQPAEGLFGDNLDQLLDYALTAGSWFEVLDRSSDTVRWLQVAGREGQSVVFRGFKGHDGLRIAVDEFLEDLRAGVTAPVNPGPRARAALERLTRPVVADAEV